MRKAWSTLQALDTKVKALAKEAVGLAKPRYASSRELTTVLMQPVRINLASPMNLNIAFSTFYNGDRDTLMIERLGAYVQLDFNVVPGVTDEGQTIQSFTDVSGVADLDYPVGFFDFLWNYEVASRASRYSRDHFVSSNALMGLGDRGEPLNLRVPLIIPKGESVVFRVQPQYFDFRGFQEADVLLSDSLFVTFVGFGHRRTP